MYLARIQQVEFAVLSPQGKADVGGVESLFACDDGKDITVLDESQRCLFALVQVDTWDIAHLLARCLLLETSNLFLGRFVIAKHGVEVGVLAHVINADGLPLADGSWQCPFLDESLPLVTLYPLGEIVIARGVSIENTIAITDACEIPTIVGISRTALLLSHGQSDGCLHKGRAIKLSQVDDELLGWVHLKRLSHIRRADELSGIPEVEWGASLGDSLF